MCYAKLIDEVDEAFVGRSLEIILFYTTIDHIDEIQLVFN